MDFNSFMIPDFVWGLRVTTTAKIALAVILGIVSLLLLEQVARALRWVGRHSKGLFSKIRKWLVRKLNLEIHRPAPEHLNEVPHGQVITCLDGRNNPIALVKVNGKAVAQFKLNNSIPSFSHSYVQEMAAPGSQPLRPAQVRETRYAIVFSDGQKTIGSGFAISLMRKTPIIVTADHVYRASKFMRGAHSEDWVSLEGLQGYTCSDVRFLVGTPDLLSRMSVRTRPAPTNLHRGNGDIFLNREKGFRAPCTFEDVLFSKPFEDFSFTHVSCTQPGDSGSPILVGRGSVPVAVHVGASSIKGKNIAVALYPLIRLLFRNDLDGDKEQSMMTNESDDRYESMFKYLPADDFYDVYSKKERRAYRLRGVKEVTRGYGVTDKGVYTVYPLGHPLDELEETWGDISDDASLPDYDPLFLRERSTASPSKAVAPGCKNPERSSPVVDQEPAEYSALADRTAESSSVQSKSSDFRRRSRCPPGRTDYTMEGVMSSLSAQPSPPCSSTKQAPRSRPTSVSRQLEQLTLRLEEVERRNEALSAPTSSQSSLSSQGTNFPPRQDSPSLELLSSLLVEQLQRAPSTPAPQVEKSTSAAGAPPRLSGPRQEKPSRNSRRRRSKASNGVVVPGGRSNNTSPTTNKQ